MRLYERPLAFIDTETTGLSPQKHEIIDVAIIFDAKVLDTPKSWTRHLKPISPGIVGWHTKIRPQRLEDAEPKALEVNKYDPKLWADAPPVSEVIDVLLDILTDSRAVLGGHNVNFDKEFIINTALRCFRSPRLGYHLVDTVTVCYEHLVPCGLDSLSLDNVRQYLGIPMQNNHTALQDAVDARDVYLRLTGRR